MDERRSRDESGFGLVEVVVAMFLFAIVAMALLPVFAQGVKQSQKQITVTTASQLASQQVELARQSAASCAALHNLSVAPASTTTDAAGRTYTTSRSAITCPTAYPATVPLTVTVASGGSTLSSVTTRILVTAS